ncbi:hypothetical protein [Nocardioides iriomotensis]|uniref:DUF1440 domain-containing protein n=1 Tax=Nocardioides iriomotensis TaxID=715784 RepID=A0A4Q5IY05_9ACTN|nr:hypothetical protein [Nocardioides iriomotensis]RYU09829.1 hypothetical protein ETU37_18455 [Nocardioides iriomotensis]
MTPAPVLRRTAQGIGAGVVAGLIGTAAMTVSSAVEARVRGRQASTAPAKAAERVLGIDRFATTSAENRFSTLVHWGYGTGWGVARGVLGAAGLSPTAAAPVHFAAMWGGAAVMLPSLGVAPPITRWGSEEVAIDVFHHLVYEVGTGLAYALLTNGRNP